jgi:DNA-directed RNA polymerase subunit RPC12/RpoP
MALITLKSFDNHVDAHLLKTKLESEGIPCVLFDENIVTLNPLYNFCVDGIKLKVVEEDAPRAMELLAALQGRPYKDEQNQEIRCPSCGSDKLYGGFASDRTLKGLLSSLLSILFAVLPIYVRKVYKCRECGFEFKPTQEAVAPS